jgi:ribosomal protein L40E
VKRCNPESYVMRAVMDLLAAERVWAIRLNTVAVRTESGRPIFSHSGGAGVPDILATPRGPYRREWEEKICPTCGAWARLEATRCASCGTELTYKACPAFLPPDDVVHVLWIECKSEKGRQSEAQKIFQQQVEAIGHHYLVARSSDDVLGWMREHGAKR